MARPKRPVASASAKPRNAKGCTWPCEAGLRATEFIRAENTLPIPTPAPTSAMQARPAPIILAAARSIAVFRWLKRGETISVQVNRLVQIKAGQDGEHIGLQYRDEKFQADEEDVDAQRKECEHPDARRKATENRQHRVSRQHIRKEPDRQSERADEIGQEL